MPGRILYRLPGESFAHEILTDAPPLHLPSLEHIGEQRGYVCAPFAPSNETPILLFLSEHHSTWTLPPALPESPLAFKPIDTEERTTYTAAFDCCREALCEERVHKIVLSRRRRLQLDAPLSAAERRRLFIAAAHRYPQSYVALIETPHHGHWLIATPELLLDDTPTESRTMALAATMTLEEGSQLLPADWSGLHRREQRLVADYIERRLDALRLAPRRSQCYVRQAARLAHLCTDFTFVRSSHCSVGNILAALHPTPAVCGLPVGISAALLERIEPHSRQYYAGFSGPVVPQEHTHIFVTLRCMALRQNIATLYAGSGLLKGSTSETEWIETERKFRTMLALLD